MTRITQKEWDARMSLLKLAKLFHDFDRTSTINELCVILYIAENEGCTMTDICTFLNARHSTMSRVVSNLGGGRMRASRSSEGYRLRNPNLIVSVPDAEDGRRKTLRLSKNGRELMRDYIHPSTNRDKDILMHGQVRAVSGVIGVDPYTGKPLIGHKLEQFWFGRWEEIETINVPQKKAEEAA